MTGDEIVTEVRLNFGEDTALTLTDADIQGWVNTALFELYELLPVPELEVLAETATVTLTDGKGPLPADLDHMLSVQVGDAPAHMVSTAVPSLVDVNPYMTPYVFVAATDGETLWVRGFTEPAAATVTFIAPPDRITNFTASVILPKWHPAIVLFTTALAYAQEEDKGQAQHYRNEALALINRTFTAPEQEGQA